MINGRWQNNPFDLRYSNVVKRLESSKKHLMGKTVPHSSTVYKSTDSGRTAMKLKSDSSQVVFEIWFRKSSWQKVTCMKIETDMTCKCSVLLYSFCKVSFLSLVINFTYICAGFSQAGAVGNIHFNGKQLILSWPTGPSQNKIGQVYAILTMTECTNLFTHVTECNLLCVKMEKLNNNRKAFMKTFYLSLW